MEFRMKSIEEVTTDESSEVIWSRIHAMWPEDSFVLPVKT